ncbi:hypothetical protein PS1_026105 [Malus domestica]
MCLHVLIHKLPAAIFPVHMPSMQLTLLFPAPLQDRHVQREIMNHRSLDHPNIIRSKEMDEHVQREIMNHSSLKNPNIIRFQEVSDHRLFSFCEYHSIPRGQ